MFLVNTGYASIDSLQGEFKVSSEINPAIIRFKELNNDLGRWKDMVEKTFKVKLGVQGNSPDRRVLVYGRDFDAVLAFGKYLENDFPLDPQLETEV